MRPNGMSPSEDAAAAAAEEGGGICGDQHAAACEDSRRSSRNHNNTNHTSSSSSSSSLSSRPRGQRWVGRPRRRGWVVGFGIVLVTTATLWGLALDSSMVARLIGATTTTTTTITSPRRRSDYSETDVTPPKERSSTSSSTLSFDDNFASTAELLPWEPWEMDALRNGSCRAPSNVPDKCCVGTSSSGGGLTESPECLAKGTEPYDRIKARAADFLRRHPVQPVALSSTRTRGWFPLSFRGSTAARSSPLSSTADNCDTCRIVDHLIVHNYTLTFQGDSVMGQAFTGLECELHRRGYQVNSTSVDYPHIAGLGWRYGLQRVETLHVSRPPGLDDHDDNNNYYYGRKATVVFRRMYRPIGDMKEVQWGLDESDIFVFDHGLHYGHQYDDIMEEFQNSTTAMLVAARNNARTKLVMWKETTPQHFNTSDGTWADGVDIVENDCVPIKEGHEGVHRAFVEQAAFNAGYTRVVNATNLTGRGGEGQPSPNAETDLVVLPYRDFLVPFHDLHGGECTHFCSSTYVYVPLWRSLRLALDAYLV